MWECLVLGIFCLVLSDIWTFITQNGAESIKSFPVLQKSPELSGSVDAMRRKLVLRHMSLHGHEKAIPTWLLWTVYFFHTQNVFHYKIVTKSNITTLKPTWQNKQTTKTLKRINWLPFTHPRSRTDVHTMMTGQSLVLLAPTVTCSILFSSSFYSHPLLLTRSPAAQMSEESHGNPVLIFTWLSKQKRNKEKKTEALKKIEKWEWAPRSQQ